MGLAIPAIGYTHDPTAAHTCQTLESFAQSYKLERGDTTLGSGEIHLKDGAAQSCFHLTQTATPTFLLRWLSSPAVQTSEFCLLPDGSLRSYSYSQQRSGVGSKGENFTLEFDWENQMVRGGRFGEVEVSDGQTDPLLLQLRVRKWLCSQPADTKLLELAPLELDYIDKKGPRSYVFAVTGIDQVIVPAGAFDTVRVERIDSKKRQARFWLDPTNSYQLIKGEQQKDDSPVVRLSLLPAD